MCKIDLIFSKKELKALRKRQRDALEKDAIRHVRTSPEIQKIILGDPRVRKMIKAKPPKKFRQMMRGDLRATLQRFKLSDF